MTRGSQRGGPRSAGSARRRAAGTPEDSQARPATGAQQRGGPAQPRSAEGVRMAERERIAQALLGGPVHRLFGIGIELQAIASATSDPSASERLQGSVGALDQTILELRRYVLGLQSE
jgi:signal transduction histidine kinase